MKIREYLLDKVFAVVCFVLAELIVTAILWLVDTKEVFIIFIVSVPLGLFIISMIFDYWRRNKYYKQLFILLNNLDKKTLLGEVVHKPDFIDGQILYEILRCSNKYENDRICDVEKQNREYREYLDKWVHEIKTPITTATLIIENEKNPTTLRIDDELRKIDRYVEQVLYYSRSTAVEKDFRVEKTTVKELVKMALKTYSKPLIQSAAHIDMDNLDAVICADIKSCAFVIGQIISNSIKYRRDNFKLNFSCEKKTDEVMLKIKDNGIGIDAADLPRVFEKGFTGGNGRRFQKSTGIGLYLCRKLCHKMNIGLSIESVQGSGTTVTLSFPLESYLVD